MSDIDASPLEVCPRCRTPRPPGATTCASCGLDLWTIDQLAAARAAIRRSPPPSQPNTPPSETSEPGARRLQERSDASRFSWRRALRIGATTGVLVFALTVVGGGFLGGGFDQPDDIAPGLAVAAAAYVSAAIVVASLTLRFRPDMPDGKVRNTTGVIVFFMVPALLILFIALWAATGHPVND